jgi:hypothetical protein
VGETPREHMARARSDTNLSLPKAHSVLDAQSCMAKEFWRVLCCNWVYERNVLLYCWQALKSSESEFIPIGTINATRNSTLNADRVKKMFRK